MTQPRDLAAVDTEWLTLLNERLSARGAKKQLADELQIPQSQVSKLCRGEQTPPLLVVRVSRALGMPLPRPWFDATTYRVLAFSARLRDRVEGESDPERRARARAAAATIVESILQAGDAMADGLFPADPADDEHDPN